MSQVELMYSRHLANLRKLAKEENAPFVDILITVSKAYKRRGLYLSLSKSAGLVQVKSTERALIDEYRIHYYEEIANTNLRLANSIINAIAIDAKQMRKAKEGLKYALKNKEKQDKNLSLGRQKGATKNKERAGAIRLLANQIDNDLLTHPNTAKWKLEERSKYIEEKLSCRTIELDGKIYSATMVNGKKYSSGTIKNWITGN